MDAYDLAHKIQKYWMALVPKNSGELSKCKQTINVYVTTPDGQRQVVGVRIDNDKILLITDGE